MFNKFYVCLWFGTTHTAGVLASTELTSIHNSIVNLEKEISSLIANNSLYAVASGSDVAD